MNLKAEISNIVQSKRPVIVAGLGKSGVAAAQFFLRLGISVWCLEKKKKSASDYPQLAEDSRVQFYFEDSLPTHLEEAALAVMSPGIPLHSEVPQSIKRAGVPLIGELELGIEFSGIPSIIVTGSNGKSTVVTLIHELLSFSGSNPHLCGNIGRPVVDLLGVSDEKPSVLVVEASSYQLEIAKVLKPKIGVILNISENHLERHGSLDAYLAAKLHLCAHQDNSDYAVLNFDDPYLVAAARKIKARVVGFGKDKSQLKSCQSYAHIEYDPTQNKDEITVFHDGGREKFSLETSRLVGEHNRYNWAAALLVAVVYGAPSDHVQRTISLFEGLEHRLEIVTSDPRRIIINDSKSTTVASTAAALTSIHKAYPDRGITLLVGGKMKLGSWDPLIELVLSLSDRVRVVCFGGDGQFIAETFKSRGVTVGTFPSLQLATQHVLSVPRVKSDIILLSPGCASFDEFNDFEERGRVFKGLVQQGG